MGALMRSRPRSHRRIQTHHQALAISDGFRNVLECVGGPVLAISRVYKF
jgi:hypothetical protein